MKRVWHPLGERGFPQWTVTYGGDLHFQCIDAAYAHGEFHLDDCVEDLEWS